MKKLIYTLAFLFIASALFGQEENAQPTEADMNTYIELMRLNLKAEKANIIVKSIQFTEQESKDFWPVYKAYEEKLDKISDQRVAFIRSFAENYETMTQEKADEIINSAFKYQRERLKLVEELYNNVKKILSPIKAAKLVQIEHQINLLIDLKINSELPMIKLGEVNKDEKNSK